MAFVLRCFNCDWGYTVGGSENWGDDYENTCDTANAHCRANPGHNIISLDQDRDEIRIHESQNDYRLRYESDLDWRR